MQQLLEQLALIESQNRYRTRRVLESPQGVDIVIDGKKCINFCSNDYLGLANHPVVIKAFKDAIDVYGVGSGSAHLICGHSAAHHALEEELAEFTNRPRALLFSTGYMANLGVINALVGQGDFVFEDKLNHASLLDGGLSCGADFKRYKHNDIQHLQTLLSEKNGKKLVVTDGVFSMDGDVAELTSLVSITQKYQAWLMVDDAHGFGVLGKKGAGLIEALNLTLNDVPILMGTFGKAFGTFGAFVAGSEALIETLIQQARTFIYTTALPPAIASATSASLKIIQQETWRREKLTELIAQFKTGAQQLGLPLMISDPPIQPILIGDSAKATQISQKLYEAGLLISAIRPPTVPKNSARLRITFSANHEFAHVEKLLNILENAFFQS